MRWSNPNHYTKLILLISTWKLQFESKKFLATTVIHAKYEGGPMRREEVTALIIDIEQRFPVDTWTINEIQIWPLIRIPLAMKLYHLDSSPNDTLDLNNLKTIKTKLLLSFISAYIKDIKNNDRINRKIDAVFLANTACRTKIGNVWYDRICEPFYEDLKNAGVECLILERGYDFRIPRAHKSIFLHPGLAYLRCLEKIKNITRTANSEIMNSKIIGWKDFVKYLTDKSFSTLLPTINEIQLLIQSIELITHFYVDILKRSQAKIGFTICYYGVNGFGFNRACRQLGIPSMDIQHGVQGHHHIAYGNWTKVPRGGYELLPDYFWCWSEYDAESINYWSKKTSRHKAIIGGNLWLYKWTTGKAAIIKEYDTIIKSLVNKKDTVINILFTLQSHFFPEQWILGAIERSPSNWRWWIRLHPGMMQSREEIRAILLRDCSKGNWELDQASELPLYAWLRHIDVHVTQSSTVVLEAKAFGVPSVITHPNGEIYQEQIGTELVNLAYSADDLINIIQKASIEEMSYTNNSLTVAEPHYVYKKIMSIQ